jgi:hypothetical protein
MTGDGWNRSQNGDDLGIVKNGVYYSEEKSIG